MKRENVTIYCASSPMIDNCFFEAATQLSTLLAQRNIGIVYGAGRVGLMGCVADCALKLGGKVTGVIPQFMVNRDWCHKMSKRRLWQGSFVTISILAAKLLWFHFQEVTPILRSTVAIGGAPYGCPQPMPPLRDLPNITILI